MRFNPRCGLRAVLALLGLVLIPAALQAKPRSTVYVTTRACQTYGLLSQQECRNAFANAEAEFSENVPVFDEQDECERQFSRCVISFPSIADPKATLFAPMMKGVRITVQSDNDRTVVPVLEGNHSAIQFDPRTILRLQDHRSSLKQQNARNRWIAFQRSQEFQDAFMPAAQQSMEPQQVSLAPKLAEWCRRFCEHARAPDMSAPPVIQAHRSLFSPDIDAGAHVQEAADTHRFSKRNMPVIRSQPRFVSNMRTQDGVIGKRTTIASLGGL